MSDEQPPGPEQQPSALLRAATLIKRYRSARTVAHGAKAALALKGSVLLAVAGALLLLMALVLLLGMNTVITSKQAAEQMCGTGSDQQAVSMGPGVPPELRQILLDAANQSHLGPAGAAILAGISDVESDFGRSNAAGVHSGVNFARCCRGPFQFNDNTWPSYASDGNGDGRKDVYNYADAAFAAGKKIAADVKRAHGDWHKSLLAYNNSSAYVEKVLSLAKHYQGDVTQTTPVANPITPEPAKTPTNGAVDLSDGLEHTVAARSYGDPIQNTYPGMDEGYKDDNLSAPKNQLSFAELGGDTERSATLLGGLPYQTTLEISYTDSSGVTRTVTARKLDVLFGEGKDTFKGHRYGISLWYRAANKLKFPGKGLVTVKTNSTNPVVNVSDTSNCQQFADMGATGPLRQRIMHYAAGELPKWAPRKMRDGSWQRPMYTERMEGGTNWNPYGDHVAWCVIFAEWAWRKAGVTDIPTTEAVAQLDDWAKPRHLWKTDHPLPGDMIVFGYASDANPGDHVALVNTVDAKGRITIIGGNQSDKVTQLGLPSLPDDLPEPPVLGYVSPPGGGDVEPPPGNNGSKRAT